MAWTAGAVLLVRAIGSGMFLERRERVRRTAEGCHSCCFCVLLLCCGGGGGDD